MEDKYQNKYRIASARWQLWDYGWDASIVGGYKSAVTKHANRLGLEMGWQTRFHDHVIRDEPAFVTITQYIINNPRNWSDDRFFT